ncbi:MAG: methionine adenosyltransferase [Candidatus Abyssobacteria bacterium SURF_17]|uniref:S-adenosylmethionine synthase n=1 Tax=Candidatus Abyssobacteria bacterium SURF_17 TaxID=2093361 RepID=A0A419F8N7_9BACT|nr:MAG: methionine adenosyltransferase [Candidatus Abyssubacteria bacterium SURF_17]
MRKGRHFFTSESVTEGHPDKICDQISDAILDAMIEQDPYSRVACECLVTTGLALIAGEITSKAQVDIVEVARGVIHSIGYVDARYGFDSDSCGVIVSLKKQSPDISMGVTATKDHEQGAGDQGMMFGFACKDTPELMPMPIALAHRVTHRLAEARKDGTLPFLRPDGKSQVTIEYDDLKPVRVDTIVVSCQHSEDVTREEIRAKVIEHVVKPVMPPDMFDESTVTFHINPTGRFVIGGPHGDCGLTGRKIIVDTYGGYASHGGGAFSGKDPSKVDRSAAYMTRCIAKNIVAADLAYMCEVQLAYAIGVAQPVSVLVNTFGTGKVDDDAIAEAVVKLVDLRPAAIIERLDLRKPIYRKTTNYGHFGREDQGFKWEERTLAKDLLKEVKG